MASRQSAQQRIISHTIDLFTGGMDSDASPYSIGEGKAILGENLEFYRDNTLRSRKGYKLDTAVHTEGQFTTQRIDGNVVRVYSDGANYATENNGTIVGLKSVNGTHSFVRVLNGVLIIEPNSISLLDGDGYQSAAVDVPLPLTGTSAVGGKLTEGIYSYTYNYLLKGGAESAQAEVTAITVAADDSKVDLVIPHNPDHQKLYKIHLFRQDPDGGYPLFIKELDVGTTSYTDTGDTQSAALPTQGIRNMPGGDIGLIQNRRLFVTNGNVLNYSYPGNYAYSNTFWTEKVNLPTGEPITAMCPLGQGVIFFGLETAIYMNGVPADGGSFSAMAIPDGCVGQQAWAQAEDGTLLYVGGAGVYAMQGASAQRISDPVNNYFKKYSSGELANSTMVYDQQNRRLLVSLPNELVVYYFQTQAWSVWTIPQTKLDWFDGSIHMAYDNHFGVLGENSTDNGVPISGRFVSGIYGLDDSVPFKLFRRIGLQVSALPSDVVNMTVRAMDTNVSYTGLPARPDNGSQWDTALWDAGQWVGNTDTTQTVALPDYIQGRYIQFTITFTTSGANSFVINNPVVIEYRPRYRYGRV